MKVSIIVPARNEEKFIEPCINSMRSQDFDDYEIIVVDNASNDNTAAIAQSMGVRVISEPKIGLPAARESGRKFARGELLVFIDADTVIPSSYLSTIYKYFKEHEEIVAVSNPYLFYDSGQIMNILAKIFFHWLFPQYSKILRAFHMSGMLFGGSFAVRREILEKTGGFSEHITFHGEDTDLSRRISKEGSIAFIENLYTFTSARRYMEQGFFHTILVYFAYHLSVIVS